MKVNTGYHWGIGDWTCQLAWDSSYDGMRCEMRDERGVSLEQHEIAWDGMG